MTNALFINHLFELNIHVQCIHSIGEGAAGVELCIQCCGTACHLGSSCTGIRWALVCCVFMYMHPDTVYSIYCHRVAFYTYAIIIVPFYLLDCCSFFFFSFFFLFFFFCPPPPHFPIICLLWLFLPVPSVLFPTFFSLELLLFAKAKNFYICGWEWRDAKC
jgi:hypothetical protein